MMAVFRFFLSLDKIALADIRRNRIQNCLVLNETLFTQISVYSSERWVLIQAFVLSLHLSVKLS